MASINQLQLLVVVVVLASSTMVAEASERRLSTGHRCRGPSRERCDEEPAKRPRRQPDGAGYRFGDEQPAASPSGPEARSSGDRCKRVRRDSMLCLVCEEPKTNAKYEQCSYVRALEPRRARAKPSARGHEDEEEEEEDEAREDEEPRTYRYSGYPSAEGSVEAAEAAEAAEERSGSGSAEERLQPAPSGEKGCREVRKDSETCTVCTDPSTGAKSERCNYAFEPKDKAYAYTKSKSFGYPYAGLDEPSAEGLAAGSDEDYGSLDYIRSESERISRRVGAEEDRLPVPQERQQRQQGQRDGTGSHVDSGFYNASQRRAEMERIVEDTGARDRSGCSRARRDGMTCYSCKDERGFSHEECVYVTEPEAATTERSRRRSREVAERDERDEPDEPDAAPLDETRLVYDKALGLKLPAYMLERSSQEIEFDQLAPLHRR